MAFLTRLAFMVVAAAIVSPLAADEPTASEDEVKAAFVYRFGGFVEWPPGAEPVGQPFVILVTGADGIARQLEALTAGRSMGGRPIEVRRLPRGQAVGSADVLFVGRNARSRLDELVAGVGDRPILVVTEIEGAIDAGSMIDLVLDGNRVRFDVAASTAERHGLKISSRVLAIARRVVRVE